MDFNFHAIPEKDVSHVLENIIPRKSLGWDSPIVPILLKKSASAIAQSLGATLKHCIARLNIGKGGRAHLSENKGVKSECKKSRENSRQMAPISTICDEYCRSSYDPGCSH